MIRLHTYCPACQTDGLAIDVTVEAGIIARSVVVAQPCNHDAICENVADDHERIADILADRARNAFTRHPTTVSTDPDNHTLALVMREGLGMGA